MERNFHYCMIAKKNNNNLNENIQHFLHNNNDDKLKWNMDKNDFR